MIPWLNDYTMNTTDHCDRKNCVNKLLEFSSIHDTMKCERVKIVLLKTKCNKEFESVTEKM